MEVLSSPSAFAAISITHKFSIVSRTSPSRTPHCLTLTIKPPDSHKPNQNGSFSPSAPSSSHSFPRGFSWTRTLSTLTPASVTPRRSLSTAGGHQHWMVIMETPQALNSREEIVNYYINTLEIVLGSKEDARMRIYDATSDTHFGFCCELDEQASKELARLPGVFSVRPDPDINSVNKDYSLPMSQSGHLANSSMETKYLFPSGSSKHWIVRMDKPGVAVVSKAQMVDHYVQILTKVLGNEKDSQMCIYHVSWQSNFGFCCDLDDECALELAGVPGVLSVRMDENFESENKDYGGDNLRDQSDAQISSVSDPSKNIKTKKLFITGLSFYTSEKTLRAAFEGFGELVEVKIIMDKISKRSKGYAFIEYTTEEAASAALKEMNGKIINGWMIIVDVAKSNPPKYSRSRPSPAAV